jgi:hypothetical protein
MASNRLSGLTEIYSLFGSLDDDSKLELGDRLTRIGSAVAALQRSTAPKRTSNLESYIKVEVQVERLRVKAGLIVIKKGNTKSPGDWYGIIQEYGRHAGSKLVQRRRRVNGKLRLGRNRRKRSEDIASSYMMRWSALPERPYIHIDSQVDGIVTTNLAGFWDNVIARLGY